MIGGQFIGLTAALRAGRAIRPLRRAALGALAGAALLAGGLPSAHASALTASQILSQFNAVVSGSFTSSSDVEGRLVANTMTGGATFHNQDRGTAAASTFAMINAINITSGVSNGNVNNGGSVNWVNSNAGHFNMNGGGTIQQNAPAFAITDFTNPLNALVTQLAGMTANSTVNMADLNNVKFNVTPDSTGTAVFSMTTAQLAMARNLVFNGTAGTIIIDVTGDSFTQNFNFNDASLNRNIIWNFANATSLNLTGWHGSILAPNATLTNSSAIEGTIYVQNFNGNGELHDYTFAGTLPSSGTPSDGGGTNAVPAPEPASMALMASGLVGLIALRRRVRRR